VARRSFRVVSRIGVERFGEGETATEFSAGDFILTHGNAWTSKMIRFGQALRIHGGDRKYTWWNHAAMLVSGDGDLVEALGAGVMRTKLSHHEPVEYHLVRTGASEPDRNEVVAFAEWAAGDANGADRERYGYVTIASIAWTLLTGGKFTFALEGQMICSGLVARGQERTDAIFNRTPSHIMPADLAKYYQVEPPANGAASSDPT
jgi:hypothetical protein